MSDRLSRNYRYEYRLGQKPGGHWNHQYTLIGRHGGLHFHVIDFGEDRLCGNRYSPGLETHYREPPDYMADQPPSHDVCWLLKQPCWHDGTSLYAEEQLLPIFDGIDHMKMFRRLVCDADKKWPPA